MSEYIDSVFDGLRIVKQAQPPEGFPSWEDWLAKEHNITLHCNKSDGRFSWVVRQVAENCETSCGGFPNYLTALAAAKKEAQNAK